jgi:hypothetical protein
LDKYRRSSPLVFSLVPRCQGWCGAQKKIGIDSAAVDPVVMAGDRVRSGVSLRSVVTQNQDTLSTVVRACVRLKAAVVEEIARSRCVTAVPVIEAVGGRVHGVWVCTHGVGEQVSVPTPSWAFLWDLEEGFAYRGDGVGMAGSWSDAGVLARRPIADALRVFDLGDRRVSALAGLARKSGRSVERYSVIEHRPGGDRRVHCVVHSVPECSALSDAVGARFVFFVACPSMWVPHRLRSVRRFRFWVTGSRRR